MSCDIVTVTCDIILTLTLSFKNKMENKIKMVKFNVYNSDSIVYKLLEGCRSVSQTKRHDYPFKESITSTEDCFLFIVFYNLY